jgi:FkbM family methyltransferase
MKRRLLQQTLPGARRLLHRLGVDLVRYSPARFWHLRRMEVIDKRGITLVVDAGANAGQYALGLRADGYRGRIVSIEPLEQAFSELRRAAEGDARWESRRVALGESEGSVEINVAGNSWSSSVLPIGERHLAVSPESAYSGREAVQMTTLDLLLRPLVRAGERIFLKLDLQGFELPALRGARELMKQVEAVETELSLVSLYDGQALLPELVTFLSRLGLDLVSLADVLTDPRTGQLLQADGLFVRRPA